MLDHLGLPAHGKWVSQWEQTKTTVEIPNLEVLEPIPTLFLGTHSIFLELAAWLDPLWCPSC